MAQINSNLKIIEYHHIQFISIIRNYGFSAIKTALRGAG